MGGLYINDSLVSPSLVLLLLHADGLFVSVMDSFDLLILNGTVVTASDIASYDIAIKNGKIALLAPQGLLATAKATRVIDAEGGYVMV